MQYYQYRILKVKNNNLYETEKMLFIFIAMFGNCQVILDSCKRQNVLLVNTRETLLKTEIKVPKKG